MKGRLISYMRLEVTSGPELISPNTHTQGLEWATVRLAPGSYHKPQVTPRVASLLSTYWGLQRAHEKIEFF